MSTILEIKTEKWPAMKKRAASKKKRREKGEKGLLKS